MATAAATQEKIDTGRVVQRGFEALGQHLPVYLALGLLLIGLPTTVMQWMLLMQVESGEDLSYSSPVYLASWVVAAFGGYLLQATIVRSSMLHLGGMDSEVGPSFATALRLILPLFALSILTWVLTMVGLVLLIVPGVIVYIMLIVSVPALIEERRGVVRSMQRSRDLTQGARGRIFLLLLLFLVVYMILAGLFAAAGEVLVQDSIWLQVILSGIAGTITSLLVAGMLASLYLELRTIKEGATTQGLAEIFS